MRGGPSKKMNPPYKSAVCSHAHPPRCKAHGVSIRPAAPLPAPVSWEVSAPPIRARTPAPGSRSANARGASDASAANGNTASRHHFCNCLKAPQMQRSRDCQKRIQASATEQQNDVCRERSVPCAFNQEAFLNHFESLKNLATGRKDFYDTLTRLAAFAARRVRIDILFIRKAIATPQ